MWTTSVILSGSCVVPSEYTLSCLARWTRRGKRLLHYTILSAQITLPENKPQIAGVCGLNRCERIQQAEHGDGEPRGGKKRRGKQKLLRISFKFFICMHRVVSAFREMKESILGGANTTRWGGKKQNMAAPWTSRAPAGLLDCDT